MKQWLWLLVLSGLLCGCAAEETFETLGDIPVDGALPAAAQIAVNLPEEAAVPASENREGQIFLCDGYEITVQTLPGGDLDRTIREISGHGRDTLEPVKSRQGEQKRYDLVWACAGEQGDRIGRAAVLDDGHYHYVLCLLADAEVSGEHRDSWDAMFRSFTLS